MRVFRGFDELPHFRCGVATIGSFDGVHSGHRILLDTVESLARQHGGESIVLTFEPHPRITLGCAEGLKLLTTTEEKLVLLERAGVDNVIIIPFTVEFSRLTPQRFLEEYIRGKAGISYLVVGYNHHFGRDKSGDFNYLSSSGEELGLHVVQPDPAQLEREIANGARFIAYGIDTVFLWKYAERPGRREN